MCHEACCTARLEVVLVVPRVILVRCMCGLVPDVAGLSLFAGKPKHGHLGAIAYGYLTREEREDGGGQGE